MKHQQKGKKYTVNHFKAENFNESFIYKNIRMVESGKSVSPNKIGKTSDQVVIERIGVTSSQLPGASAPVILTNSKQNVDSEFYRQEVMVYGTLKSSLEIHYPDNKYVFWPDLASSHASEETVEAFESSDIKVIDVDFQRPCCTSTQTD